MSVADAARVSLRTVRRTFSGEERPFGSILLWLAEAGIDARKVWVPVTRCGQCSASMCGPSAIGFVQSSAR